VNRSVTDVTAPGESAWTDHDVSRQIATEAGLLLVELRRSAPESADQRWLRDEGDARSHRLIMGRLAELRPHDAILSEEGKDDQGRLGHHRVWLVDPLDGTREFGETAPRRLGGARCPVRGRRASGRGGGAAGPGSGLHHSGSGSCGSARLRAATAGGQPNSSTRNRDGDCIRPWR